MAGSLHSSTKKPLLGFVRLRCLFSEHCVTCVCFPKSGNVSAFHLHLCKSLCAEWDGHGRPAKSMASATGRAPGLALLPPSRLAWGRSPPSSIIMIFTIKVNLGIISTTPLSNEEGTRGWKRQTVSLGEVRASLAGCGVPQSFLLDLLDSVSSSAKREQCPPLPSTLNNRENQTS